VAYLLKAAPLVEILVLQVYKLRLLIDRVKSARFGVFWGGGILNIFHTKLGGL